MVLEVAPSHSQVTSDNMFSAESAAGAQIGWSRLKEDSVRVAAGLRDKLSLSPSPFTSTPGKKHRSAVVSPIVLIHLPNCLPYAPIKFGTLAAGLTVSMANPALTAGEMAHIISLSRPAVIVTQPSALQVVRDALALVKDPELDQRFSQSGRVFTVDLAGGDYGLDVHPSASLERRTSGLLTRDWKWLMDPAQPPFTIERMSGEENRRRAAFILWSSGTSGKSKGQVGGLFDFELDPWSLIKISWHSVVVSHRAFIANVQMLWYGYPWMGPNEVCSHSFSFQQPFN
jgi:4-coumarate--CoA ligase